MLLIGSAQFLPAGAIDPSLGGGIRRRQQIHQAPLVKPTGTPRSLVGLMLLFALVGRSCVRQHYIQTIVTAATDTATSERPAPSEEEVAGLSRSVRIETSLAVLVLAVSALLVNTTPAKAAFAPPYTGKSAAGPLNVAVDIYPARKGLNGLHVCTVGAGGRTVDVAQVTGQVVRTGGHQITVNPKHKSLGH